ncbi:protein takeout [Stomoxys calcitrans]|uniref:Hemolymph juvenile hormone binding protein n=1 Tax=Stomoxys calcitrans TaxID=35570 RepID=A0A1I8QD37_STOCA|nr:protein takeout [Stomoxys calcitrans]
MQSFLTLTLLGILAVSVAELPADIEKCKNGDGACLKKSIQTAIEKYYGGSREINLLSFDPLHVKKMVLKRNPASPVNVDITFTDFDMLGLKDLKIISVEGLQADLSGRNVFVGKVPEMRLKGQYKVEGRVLVLPVVGDGPCDLMMKNAEFKLSYDLKKVEKNGKIFAKLEHVKLEFVPGNIHFQFDNLFNGDKQLGDNMNVFINENWHDIWSEIGPTFTEAVGLVLEALLNAFFEKNSYEEIFL